MCLHPYNRYIKCAKKFDERVSILYIIYPHLYLPRTQIFSHIRHPNRDPQDRVGSGYWSEYFLGINVILNGFTSKSCIVVCEKGW
jgi:hypothetical protein